MVVLSNFKYRRIKNHLVASLDNSDWHEQECPSLSRQFGQFWPHNDKIRSGGSVGDFVAGPLDDFSILSHFPVALISQEHQFELLLFWSEETSQGARCEFLSRKPLRKLAAPSPSRSFASSIAQLQLPPSPIRPSLSCARGGQMEISGESP